MINKVTYKKLRTAIQQFIDINEDHTAIFKSTFSIYYPFCREDVDEAWPKICEDLSLWGDHVQYYQDKKLNKGFK